MGAACRFTEPSLVAPRCGRADNRAMTKFEWALSVHLLGVAVLAAGLGAGAGGGAGARGGGVRGGWGGRGPGGVSFRPRWPLFWEWLVSGCCWWAPARLRC